MVVEVLVGAVLVRELHGSRQLHRSRLVGVVLVGELHRGGQCGRVGRKKTIRRMEGSKVHVGG